MKSDMLGCRAGPSAEGVASVGSVWGTSGDAAVAGAMTVEGSAKDGLRRLLRVGRSFGISSVNSL